MVAAAAVVRDEQSTGMVPPHSSEAARIRRRCDAIVRNLASFVVLVSDTIAVRRRCAYIERVSARERQKREENGRDRNEVSKFGVLFRSWIMITCLFSNFRGPGENQGGACGEGGRERTSLPDAHRC